MLTHCVSLSQKGGTEFYSISFQHRVHYKNDTPISLPGFIASRDQPVQRFGRFACVLFQALALAVAHHLHWTLGFQCVEKNIWLAATSQLEKQVSLEPNNSILEKNREETFSLPWVCGWRAAASSSWNSLKKITQRILTQCGGYGLKNDWNAENYKPTG